MAPLLLDCAHTVCAACMEALSAVEPVCCPVCSSLTSGGAHNYAMAEVAEAAWAEETVETANSDVIMDPYRRRGDMTEADPTCAALADQLVLLLDRLSAASVALDTGSESMTGAKADLIAHAEASIVRFNTVMDDVIVRVNEYRASTIATVQAVRDDRLKALEAQADELAVSAGQLEACVAGGRAAMTRGNTVSIKHALDSALALSELEKTDVLPRVPLKLDIVADVGPTLTALADLARLRLYEVDADKSSVSGNGLKTFVAGPRGLENNVITVTCMEADGGEADWVTASDIAVSVKSLRSGDVVGHVASAGIVKPGVIEAVYAVDDVGEVELSASVCGVTLAGGPWRAVSGCRAQGLYVATLPVISKHNNRGLAVTSDAMHMVVSNSGTYELTVYRLSNGGHVRSFRGAATGPIGLCMTKENTILVARYYCKVIQELTLEGEHVKFIGLGVKNVWCVAIHGDVVAVGKFGGVSPSRVMLFSYASGALMSQFGTYGSGEGEYTNVSGIAFTTDGKHLVIADHNNVSLTTVEGVFVRHYDAGAGYKTVAVNSAGGIVIANYDNDRVCVFSYVDGTLLRSWGVRGTGNGQFMSPTALAISHNRLYVLDHKSARVQVFE
jgi:DNA-binding beta-propeller fold protein YncE